MGAKASKTGTAVQPARPTPTKPLETEERGRSAVGAEQPRMPPAGAAPPGEETGSAVTTPREQRGSGPHEAAGATPFFLGRGNLRRRGWTETGISRFLGAADALAPNPVVRSAAHMRLYDEARVARVEATEAWQQWHAASQQRRESNRLRAEERARERADRLARLGVHAEAAKAANRRGAAAGST